MKVTRDGIRYDDGMYAASCCYEQRGRGVWKQRREGCHVTRRVCNSQFLVGFSFV